MASCNEVGIKVLDAHWCLFFLQNKIKVVALKITNNINVLIKVSLHIMKD